MPLLLPPDINAFIALALVVVAIFLFTREKLLLETSSLLIFTFVLLWFYVVPMELNGEPIGPRELLASFGNQALVTISALMILARGMETTGALQTIGYALAGLWGRQPRLAFLLTLITAAGLSMFLNNTPVVAAIMPLLVAVSLQSKVPPSGLLMPVGFATIIGGMATTIGTSTNLLVVSLAADLGMRELQMFDFALPVFVVGSVAILYLWLIAPLLLPARQPPMENIVPRVFGAALLIGDDSRANGRTLAEVFAGRNERMKVVAIKRDGLSLARLPTVVLREGDIVKISDTPERLKDYEQAFGGTLLASTDSGSVTGGQRRRSADQLAEVVVTRGSALYRRSLKSSKLLAEFNLLALALHRPGSATSESAEDIATAQLEAGDVVLVQGSGKAIDRLKLSGSGLVLDGRMQVPRTTRAAPALLIVIAVVVTGALGIAPISFAAMLGFIAMLLTKCLTWRDALGALDRRIIMVIVASLALGTAMMTTGAARYLAELYIMLTQGMQIAFVLAGFILIIALLTEVITNNAVAVLGTPIAISISNQLGVSPEPFVLGVLYGANMSYMTPFGYQTNLLVMSAGGYKFADFFRAGLPLQIIMWGGISIAMAIIYDL
jgi:di/tricarboxylate transporter